MKTYDIAVIGGGPAGYLAAERAAEAGKKVILAEKNAVGGVCLNEGCIPTKTLLHAAKIFEYGQYKGKEFGVSCENPRLHHPRAIARKQDVVKTLVGGVSSALARKGIDIIQTEAGLRKEDNGFVLTCGNETIRTSKALIATGSEPVIPNIPGVAGGLADGSVLTSREILEMREIPEQLVVVGAGVIGLEMADYFSIAGSRVTVVEMTGHIGGPIDMELSQTLQRNLENMGIHFVLGSRIFDVSGSTACVKTPSGTQEFPYDKLLMCMGRKPSLNIPGLSGMNLYMEHGAPVVDKHCETNIPGLYAAGDVNGKYMLAHVAYREAEVAVNHMMGKADEMNYTAIPGVIYTQPEAAFCGLTEQQATEKGIQTIVKKASINLNGRHIAENGLSGGFCKLVLDGKGQTILGASLLCSYASEIIYPLTLMIQNKIPLEGIKRTIFPHPTVCEIIRETIFTE